MTDFINCLIIAAFTFCVYFRSFKFTIIQDDIDHYNQISKGLFDKPRSLLGKIKERLYGGGTLYGFCGEKQHNEFNTTIDHVFTTGIHTMVCILIYYAFGASTISFCASLLYACNPANNQTSLWLNGRRYVINIILVLGFMMLGWYGLPLYFATAIFQVNAIFAPVLLGPLGLFVIPIAYLICKREIKDKINLRSLSIRDPQMLKISPQKIIVITKLYGAYFFHMIFPKRTLLIYPILNQWGLTDKGNKDAYAFNKDFLIGVFALLLTVAGLVYFKSWLFVFMALSTLQWCGILPFNQQFADRYISLSNVFMMFFVSTLAHNLLGEWAFVALGAFGAYYVASLMVTMRMYKDIHEMSRYNLYWFPENVFMREFRITYFLRINDLASAWAVVKEGLVLNPTDMKLNMMAALCMRRAGDLDNMNKHIAVAEENCYIGFESVLEQFKNQRLISNTVPMTLNRAERRRMAKVRV